GKRRRRDPPGGSSEQRLVWPRDSSQQGIEGGPRPDSKVSGRGQGVALRGHDGKSQADQRGGRREPIRRLVSGPGLQRLLEPQRTARIHHQRRQEDRRRRRVAEGRAALGRTFVDRDRINVRSNKPKTYFQGDSGGCPAANKRIVAAEHVDVLVPER